MSTEETKPSSSAAPEPTPAAPAHKPRDRRHQQRYSSEEPFHQILLLPLGVLLLFAAVVLALLLPDQWSNYVSVGGVGLIFLVSHTAMRPDGLAGLFSRTFHWSTAYGLNNLVLVLAVAGITVVLNIVAYRHSTKTDWTQNQLHSLSKQTLDTLAGLKRTVKVTGFYPEVHGASRDAQVLTFYRKKVKELLDDYKRYANDKLTVQLIDPFKDPAMTEKYKLAQDDWGTVFFEIDDAAGSRKVKVVRDKLFARSNPFSQGMPPFKGEEAFTGALLELTSGGALTVYFTEGHGERSVDTDQPSGYATMKVFMERERYAVKGLKLFQTSKVPDDCSVLVVCGPKKPFAENEIKAMREYLAKPGKGAMFLLDFTPQPGLKELLGEQGIEWSSNIVVEMDPNYALMGSAAFFQAIPRQHALTDELVKSKMPVAFNGATYLNKLAKQADQFEFTSIVESSETAYAEFDLTSLGNKGVKMDPGIDKQGPVSLGWAIEAKRGEAPKPEAGKSEEDAKKDQPKTRMVVLGDSDFGSDAVLGSFPIGTNADLFLNAVAWLSFATEKTGTIRPKDEGSNTVTLTNRDKVVIGRLTILVYPGLVLILGICVWLRRRSL